MAKTDMALSLQVLRALGDLDARSGVTPDTRRARNADSDRLHRKARRKGAESDARSPGVLENFTSSVICGGFSQGTATLCHFPISGQSMRFGCPLSAVSHRRFALA